MASFACLAVGVLQFDKPFKAKVLTETQERNKIVKRFKIVDFVRTYIARDLLKATRMFGRVRAWVGNASGKVKARACLVCVNTNLVVSKFLVSVVQKLDSSVLWVNHSLLD